VGVCGVHVYVCMCGVCNVEVMVSHSKGAIIISLSWLYSYHCPFIFCGFKL